MWRAHPQDAQAHDRGDQRQLLQVQTGGPVTLLFRLCFALSPPRVHPDAVVAAGSDLSAGAASRLGLLVHDLRNIAHNPTIIA